MKLTSNNFLDLARGSFREAKVVVVPFGFEASTTYGQGTARGPQAIIKASQQVEFFDEELWQNTAEKVNIVTLSEIKPLTPKKLIATISKILQAKKLPIVLGGEHSITSFIIEAYKKSGFGAFSILQFDAHADLREKYQNKKYSHACAMRRCLDFPGINLVQVGIRSIAEEDGELIFWERNQKRIKTFWAKDKKKWKIEEIIKGLRNEVFISFDVDGLDSSVMPSVGTPYPGGLEWQEALDVLRAVCQKRKIIGADFVELSPIKGMSAPDFLVAKLIYKTLGYACGKK